MDLKQQILSLVAEYTKTAHAPKGWHKGDRINYAGRVYDEAELVNLVDSALEFWLTAGHWSDKFENGVSDYLGIRFCSFVNSGSSANLLAFMALTSHLLGERRIKRGDEVITVAAGFPTTVAPIVQYGAVPVFCDVTIPQYNIDTSQLEEGLSNRTKAVMLAHTLGNPFDLSAVKAFCEKYNLWLIEDNCDSLGTEYDGKKTGTFGDIGTSSFYPPHHITTGEGGAVYTDNPLLHKIIRSFRDWGRDCGCASGQDNRCGHRFERQFGTLPFGYDHKYVYSHLGYNLKATDMQAAIGVAQLNKLPGFVERRQHNFEYLKNSLSSITDKLILPEACQNSNPSWFGFLMTCCEGIDRNKVVAHLENNGIQTRSLFAGNLTRHPCLKHERYEIIGDLRNTNRIMEDSFWVGVYPGMTEHMLVEIVVKTVEAVNNV